MRTPGLIALLLAAVLVLAAGCSSNEDFEVVACQAAGLDSCRTITYPDEPSDWRDLPYCEPGTTAPVGVTAATTPGYCIGGECRYTRRFVSVRRCRAR